MVTFLPYLLLVPLVFRLAQAVVYRRIMGERLDNCDQQREEHRGILLAMAGFSFSAVLAVVALGDQAASAYAPAVVCLLVSFLAHVAALNLQGYKAKRWQDQLGDTLMEIASLGLVLSIPVFLFGSSAATWFKWASLVACVGVWTADFVFRFVIAGKTFSGWEVYQNVRRKEEAARVAEGSEVVDGIPEHDALPQTRVLPRS